MTNHDPDQDRTFGQLVYEQLRSRGHFHLLSHRFNYDGIQRFKRASREEVVKMLIGWYGYATVQAVKNQSPKEVADALIQDAARQAEAVAFMLVC